MTRSGKATAVATLGIVLTFASGPSRAQHGGENALARRIEGTWLVQLTLRQCDTGVEIPTRRSRGCTRSSRGGAMISTPPANPALLIRDMACGRMWAAVAFRTRYGCLGSLQYGALTGIATVARNIVLSRDGDRLKSNDDSEFRDLAGNLIGRRCAAVTGTRLD